MITGYVKNHKSIVSASGEHGFILVCNSTVWRCGVGPLHRPEASQREFKQGAWLNKLYSNSNQHYQTRSRASKPERYQQIPLTQQTWRVRKVRSMGGYQDITSDTNRMYSAWTLNRSTDTQKWPVYVFLIYVYKKVWHKIYYFHVVS